MTARREDKRLFSRAAVVALLLCSKRFCHPCLYAARPAGHDSLHGMARGNAMNLRGFLVSPCKSCCIAATNEETL
jgi:hypothetical protein